MEKHLVLGLPEGWQEVVHNRPGGAGAVRVGLKAGKRRGWLRPGWLLIKAWFPLLQGLAPPATSKVHPLSHQVLTFFPPN